MKKPLLILGIALTSATCLLFAQDGQRPPPPEHGGGGQRLHLLPRGAEESLNLTADQHKQLADLEAEVQTKVEKILTPEQLEKLKAMRPPQPPGGQGEQGGQPAGGPGERGEKPPGGQEQKGERPAPPKAKGATTQPAAEGGKLTNAAKASNAPSAKPLPAGVTRLPVTFSGGHETEPVDHGRPVKLIAAALGVKDEVFREAFSHVHPAGPGSGGPSDAEARTNKAALMNALGKFGITDAQINQVSNFYRYPPGSKSLWKNQPATANALVKNGAVIGYEITNGGYGYTTAPALSVPELKGATGKAELGFSKDMEANGAVTAIIVAQDK